MQRHLSEAQRTHLLDAAQIVTPAPETLIVEEGQPAHDVVLVLEGTVRIEKDYLGARVPIDELGAGEILGKVSYLLGTGATATVEAMDDVRLAIIPREGWTS